MELLSIVLDVVLFVFVITLLVAFLAGGLYAAYKRYELREKMRVELRVIDDDAE